MRGRDVRWLTARPIAHRGLHDIMAGIPENTLAAFAVAMTAGYAIECDVLLTADGEVVVFHDEELSRLTGAEGIVAETTLAAMKELRVLGTAEAPPSLAELLALVGGRVPLVIELKSHGAVGPLEAAVARLFRGYRGEAAVMAFAPASVAWFRRNAPDIVRGQLSASYRGEAEPDAFRRFAYRHLLMLPWTRPDFVAHEVTCLRLPMTRLWRRFGGPLLTWTVKARADLAEARRYAAVPIFEGIDPSAG